MEAVLLVEGVGGFIGFEHIEEVLTLDELLLLHEQLSKRNHNRLQMMGVVQGVEIPDLDGTSNSKGDLPNEILEAERAWQEKKRQHLEEQGITPMPESTEGLESKLGYSRE